MLSADIYITYIWKKKQEQTHMCTCACVNTQNTLAHMYVHTNTGIHKQYPPLHIYTHIFSLLPHSEAWRLRTPGCNHQLRVILMAPQVKMGLRPVLPVEPSSLSEAGSPTSYSTQYTLYHALTLSPGHNPLFPHCPKGHSHRDPHTFCL